MRRREFIKIVAGSAVACWPFAVTRTATEVSGRRICHSATAEEYQRPLAAFSND